MRTKRVRKVQKCTNKLIICVGQRMRVIDGLQDRYTKRLWEIKNLRLRIDLK